VTAPRPFDVNLATRPLRNNVLILAGYGVLAVLAIAFTIGNVLAWRSASIRIGELDTELAAGRERMAEITQAANEFEQKIRATNLKDLRTRVGAANEVLAERDLSWTHLLNDLEEVVPYKVRLLELRPLVTAEGILIEVRAIAMNLDNFWEFQQNLQDHPKFRHVYPVGYTKPEGRDEVVFALTFNYYPRPDEAPADGQKVVEPTDPAVRAKAARGAHPPSQQSPEPGETETADAAGGPSPAPAADAPRKATP